MASQNPRKDPYDREAQYTMPSRLPADFVGLWTTAVASFFFATVDLIVGTRSLQCFVYLVDGHYRRRSLRPRPLPSDGSLGVFPCITGFHRFVGGVSLSCGNIFICAASKVLLNLSLCPYIWGSVPPVGPLQSSRIENRVPSGYVKIASENGHRNSWFTH